MTIIVPVASSSLLHHEAFVCADREHKNFNSHKNSDTMPLEIYTIWQNPVHKPPLMFSFIMLHMHAGCGRQLIWLFEWRHYPLAWRSVAPPRSVQHGNYAPLPPPPSLCGNTEWRTGGCANSTAKTRKHVNLVNVTRPQRYHNHKHKQSTNTLAHHHDYNTPSKGFKAHVLVQVAN